MTILLGPFPLGGQCEAEIEFSRHFHPARIERRGECIVHQMVLTSYWYTFDSQTERNV